ncbi:MAG: hypothetical protein Q9208_003308 [Pyrenodesmia sp. 3 TL-2023]
MVSVTVTVTTSPEGEQLKLIRSRNFEYRFYTQQSFRAFTSSVGEFPRGVRFSVSRGLQARLYMGIYVNAQIQKEGANELEYLRFLNHLEQIKCLHARLHYHSPIILDEDTSEDWMQRLWEAQVMRVRIKVERLMEELGCLGKNREMKEMRTKNYS